MVSKILTSFSITSLSFPSLSLSHFLIATPDSDYWTPRLDLPIFKHQDVGEVGELAPEQQESVPTLAPRRDDGDDDDEDEDEEMANEDDDMEEVEV